MPVVLRQLFMTWLPVLLSMACQIVLPWYSYQKGIAAGRLQVKAEVSQETVDSLTALLNGHKKLIADANQASEQILQISHQRQQQDQATTETLKEVLNETASLRADCVFNADVMRQLETARQRAAEAAASGLAGAVSGTGQPSR